MILYVALVATGLLALYLAHVDWWIGWKFSRKPGWCCFIEPRPDQPKAVLLHVPYVMYVLIRLETRKSYLKRVS